MQSCYGCVLVYSTSYGLSESDSEIVMIANIVVEISVAGRTGGTWRKSDMRIVVSGALAIAAAVLFVTACNSNDAYGPGRTASGSSDMSTKTPPDGIRRITVTELKAAFDKGTVFIVDVRAPEAYAVEHIKGSYNIPEPSTAARSGEFPRDKLIVTYCS